MTPQELQEARETLRLSLSEMGAMLGYTGKRENITQQVWRLENGVRPIRPIIARLVRGYLSGYRPDDWP